MKIGRIYNVISGRGDEVYIGSTFNQLNNRFRDHKSRYKQGAKYSITELFNKYGVNNCRIILLKEYAVIDKRHLETKELLWIKKLNAINRYEPCGGLLRKEYLKQKDRKRRALKIQCHPCDIEIGKGKLSRHHKTQKHTASLFQLLPQGFF